MNISEDRGQILKIEDSPLKNQADGQPRYLKLFDRCFVFIQICKLISKL